MERKGALLQESASGKNRMNIIICTDDQSGMLFNGRRQSRDRVMIADMLQTVRASGGALWIRPFSEKLLAGAEGGEAVRVDSHCMEKAAEEDYCFIEDLPLADYQVNIGSVIVYRWNRRYPADFWLDLELTEWKRKSVCASRFSARSRIAVMRRFS